MFWCTSAIVSLQTVQRCMGEVGATNLSTKTALIDVTQFVHFDSGPLLPASRGALNNAVQLGGY